MAVVIDLDAVGRLGQVEQLGDLAQQLRLRGRFGQPPVERLDRVALGLIEQAAARAPLWRTQRDLAPGLLRQRLRQHRLIGQVAIDEDGARRWHLLVELHQELREHLLLRHVGDMAGEERAVAPILAATDEERLDPDDAVLRREREDIGIADPVGVDELRPLDEGQRLETIAQDHRALEIHRLGGALHLRAQLGLDLRRLAGEELLRLADQLGIAIRVDAADAPGPNSA